MKKILATALIIMMLTITIGCEAPPIPISEVNNKTIKENVLEENNKSVPSYIMDLSFVGKYYPIIDIVKGDSAGYFTLNVDGYLVNIKYSDYTSQTYLKIPKEINSKEEIINNYEAYLDEQHEVLIITKIKHK